MIVFFTFDLFSSTPAPEDGSRSRFGYGGSRGRGSCHGWWGDWWQTLKLPALGDVKIAEIECHEQLKRRCVKRCSHSNWAPYVMFRQKQPSILLVWLRLQTCEVFQDGGTMLPFLCSCQLSENSQISQNVKRHGGSSGCSHDVIGKHCCSISNYILKIKGVSAIFAFSLLCQSALVYTTNYTQLNLLTCNLDRLPDFTQMEALGNPVGGQIFHNIMSQHFQLQLMKSNDSLAPSPKRQLYKACLHLTPPPAWVDGYAVVTISDVAWLAGKKEKTRPEISGAEKYDLRALESSLMAVARGILVGKGGDDVGAGGPPSRQIGAEVAGVCF